MNDLVVRCVSIENYIHIVGTLFETFFDSLNGFFMHNNSPPLKKKKEKIEENRFFRYFSNTKIYQNNVPRISHGIYNIAHLNQIAQNDVVERQSVTVPCARTDEDDNYAATLSGQFNEEIIHTPRPQNSSCNNRHRHSFAGIRN